MSDAAPGASASAATTAQPASTRTPADAVAIDVAVAALRAGELVAFPTETVYGLGADASNPDAVRRIFEAKGRPADHPLIVHLASPAQLAGWAREIPDAAHALARAFWPGPMTLVLKRHPSVIDGVTGGQDTVGLRIPSHPVAHALLAAFGGGIAGPSANRFGRISPTTAAHVREEFGDRVRVVLEGGPSEVGIESTIVDLSGDAPTLLRPGMIEREAIEAVLGVSLRLPGTHSPRASGMLASHYAPRTPTRLVAADDLAHAVAANHGRAAVLARSAHPAGLRCARWITAPHDPAGYARALYGNLRALDAVHADLIFVETVPDTAAWSAIRDRLGRAATPA